MRFTTAAIAAIVLLAMPAIQAQRGRGGQAGQKTPLQMALYEVADALGMLRTAQEVDRVATVQYWAAGTMTANGQRYSVTSYLGSVNYHLPGMRVDITRMGTDGKAQRTIEVVNDTFAWNETEPGIDGTPATGTAALRQLQIWMLPQGVVKAATNAGAATMLSTGAGATAITFPIVAIGATVKATIDARHVITDVEGRLGTTVVNVTYSNYGDWNGDDYLSDVMFPKHIVQKVDGVTVLDIVVSKTNTYNPYVVMPVPENIERAQAGGRSAAAR